MKQFLLWVMLISAVSTALVGQAELIGEPWHHYISVIGIAATAVSGVLINFQKQWDGVDRRDKDAK